jgi:hypothetical protein
MSKQSRSPNDENLGYDLAAASNLVIRDSFVIRHSDFVIPISLIAALRSWAKMFAPSGAMD